MTYTGPQKVPFASTAYWYQDNYPGDRMESNVGVMHTTEGYTVPSYDGGAVAPNITGLPDIANKKIKWYQHFDVDCSSRALVNASGGVQTNTLNAFQIELVGTCDPTHRLTWGSKKAGVDYLFWPDAPDWALAEVAKLVKWLADNHGFKLVSTVTWKAYPGSYGASNGVRLSGAQWLDYYGWLGHQHVPENLHGDPGDLDMAKILAYAKGSITGSSDNVALTKDDIHNIWYADEIPAQPEPYNNPDWDTNKTWTVKYAVYTTVRAGREANARLEELKGRLATADSKLDSLKAQVESLQLAGIDLDALAAKVADVLHDRLAG